VLFELRGSSLVVMRDESCYIKPAENVRFLDNIEHRLLTLLESNYILSSKCSSLLLP
jgi:hypothetical protein